MFAARCEAGGARFEKTRMNGPDIAGVGFWVVRVRCPPSICIGRSWARSWPISPSLEDASTTQLMSGFDEQLGITRVDFARCQPCPSYLRQPTSRLVPRWSIGPLAEVEISMAAINKASTTGYL